MTILRLTLIDEYFCLLTIPLHVQLSHHERLERLTVVRVLTGLVLTFYPQISGHTWYSNKIKCVLNSKIETLLHVLCILLINDTRTTHRLKAICVWKYFDWFAGFQELNFRMLNWWSLKLKFRLQIQMDRLTYFNKQGERDECFLRD